MDEVHSFNTQGKYYSTFQRLCKTGTEKTADLSTLVFFLPLNDHPTHRNGPESKQYLYETGVRPAISELAPVLSLHNAISH